MAETNAVIQLLEGLVAKKDLQIAYKNRCYGFSDEDLPVRVGVAFVKGQLQALQDAAAAAAKADVTT